jgi:hypothetical protein
MVLREAMHAVQEVRTLVLPYLRSRTLAVRGTLDRFSQVTSLFLRYIRIGLLVAAGVLTYYALDVHDVIDERHNETLSELLGWLPQLSLSRWAVLIVLMLVFARLLRRAVSVLRSR